MNNEENENPIPIIIGEPKIRQRIFEPLPPAEQPAAELSFTIHGEPLTFEQRIIAALVKRAGGYVTLTQIDLQNVSGLIVSDNGEGFFLNLKSN